MADRGVILEVSTLISPWSGERIPYRLQFFTMGFAKTFLSFSDGYEFNIKEIEFFTGLIDAPEIGSVSLEINGAPIEVPYVGYIADEVKGTCTVFVNQNVLDTLTSSLKGYPYTGTFEGLTLKTKGDIYKAFESVLDLYLHTYDGEVRRVDNIPLALWNYGRLNDTKIESVYAFTICLKSLFYPEDSKYYVSSFKTVHANHAVNYGHIKVEDGEDVKGLRIDSIMEEQIFDYLKALDIQTYKYSNYRWHLQV